MNTDPWLFFVVVGIVALTIYLLATNKMTAEERDAMLNDKEMWP